MAGDRKLVVLARPNFLIVEHMRAFLRLNGFEPVRLTALADFHSMQFDAVAGVVISSAVISSIEQSAAEVLDAVRTDMPRVPVAFATLVDFEKSSLGLRSTVFSGRQVPLVPSDSMLPDGMALGGPDTYLVLRRDDLGDEAGPAGDLIKQHFGR
jgi:hypothetical protein